MHLEQHWRGVLTCEVEERLHQTYSVKDTADDDTDEHRTHSAYDLSISRGQRGFGRYITDVLSKGSPTSRVAADDAMTRKD